MGTWHLWTPPDDVGGLLVGGKPTVKQANQHDVTAVLCVSKKTTPEEVSAGRTYVYAPMPDSHVAVPVERLAYAAGFAYTWLNQGHTVLVHCLAGRNRSVLTAALVLYWRQVARGAELLELLRARRPGCLANPVFERYVLEELS